MNYSFKTFNKYFTLLPFHHHHYHPFLSPSSVYYSCSQSRSSSHSSSSQPTTFMDIFKAIAKQEVAVHGSVAIRADQKSYSYNQLISSAQKISNLLCENNVKGNLGGARIGIVAKPSAEFVAGILATWFSGGVAVPLALSYPEAELLYVMNNSDVSAILSTEDHSELMQSIANKTSSRFFHIPPVSNKSSEKSNNGHLKNGESDADRIFLENIERSNEDPALILYTSGTTGKPKGVVHTHKSILAQVQALTKAWEYTSADRFLHCLPLHHVHGLFNSLLAPLYVGSTVEFLPKFSVSGIWKRWRDSCPTEGYEADDAITVFTGVPTMYTRLIQGYHAMDPELQATSASGARNLRLMDVSAILSTEDHSELMQIIANKTSSRFFHIPPVSNKSSEKSNNGHLKNGESDADRIFLENIERSNEDPALILYTSGTTGKPKGVVHTHRSILAQVKILVDEEHESEESGVGELCVKSASLFKEYYKLPEVTKESFTDDGFFKTGDAVTTDKDGYFIILGRKNADIIKNGGYKLSALEIESVIVEHPTVSECCVLGVSDKDYGEIVCAIIVPATKSEEESKSGLSLAELSTWARTKLAPYKIPTRLIVWESLPRNAMGKVNKKELKKLVTSE